MRKVINAKDRLKQSGAKMTKTLHLRCLLLNG